LENPYLSGVPRFALEQMSSAYEVIGIKRQNFSGVDVKLMQSIYEQRRMILLRRQEIDFYSLKFFEKSGEILESQQHEIREITGFSTDSEASEFLELLEKDEKLLREFRDSVITKFLQ
jgi:hypothetical protein